MVKSVPKCNFVLLTLLSCPAFSFAQETAPSTSVPVESDNRYSIIPFTTHGYVGASLGESKYDIDCASGFSCDRKGTGFKIFTGGRVRDIIGLEVSVLEMGKAVRAGGTTWARGLNLSVIGNLPIGDRFSVFGRLGGTYGWTKTESNTSSLQSGKDRGVGLAYGVGINFNLSTNWGLRGEWERHRFEFVNAKDDVDLYTIGFNYKF